MADGDAPTIEQRQECKIRMLERRVRSQAEELRKLQAILIERKDALRLLGIAWSTRGADTMAGEVTREELDRLVKMVNRIHLRLLNTEYRIAYATVDDRLKAANAAAWAKVTEIAGWRMDEMRKREAAESEVLRLRAELDGSKADG
jgi:hypothetical protein